MRLSATPRRNFLKSLAALPGLGALSAAPAAAARTAAGRDVIAELGVRKFINAAGTYTSLTASLMPPEVMEAIQIASRSYAPLDELHDRVGERIAQLLECEAAMVSAGCASALTLGTAGCLTGEDREKIRQVPELTGMKTEVVIQKTHRVGYDHAVRNTGVKLIEVETPEEFESALGPQTAMIFFLNSAAPEGQLGHEQAVAIAKKKGVPILIDAAADVPPADNLFRFTKMGFDLVAFSGGKGLRGPQSSGLLLGRADLIRAARMNGSPNGDSVCRTNKVNKEEMVGLLVALELFLNRDHEATWKEWESRCDRIASAVKDVEGVKTETFVPEIANAVPHLRVSWDYDARGLTPRQVTQALREGEPSIEARPGSGEALEIGVWMMEPGDDEVVARRLREILAA